MPILIARFQELVETYNKDRVPFDLMDTFLYQYHLDTTIIYEDIAVPVMSEATGNGRRWIEGLCEYRLNGQGNIEC